MTTKIIRRLEKIEALMAPPQKFDFTLQFINPATHKVTRVLRIRSSESGIEEQWSRPESLPTTEERGIPRWRPVRARLRDMDDRDAESETLGF